MCHDVVVTITWNIESVLWTAAYTGSHVYQPHHLVSYATSYCLASCIYIIYVLITHNEKSLDSASCFESNYWKSLPVKMGTLELGTYMVHSKHLDSQRHTNLLWCHYYQHILSRSVFSRSSLQSALLNNLSGVYYELKQYFQCYNDYYLGLSHLHS